MQRSISYPYNIYQNNSLIFSPLATNRKSNIPYYQPQKISKKKPRSKLSYLKLLFSKQNQIRDQRQNKYYQRQGNDYNQQQNEDHLYDSLTIKRINKNFFNNKINSANLQQNSSFNNLISHHNYSYNNNNNSYVQQHYGNQSVKNANRVIQAYRQNNIYQPKESQTNRNQIKHKNKKQQIRKNLIRLQQQQDLQEKNKKVNEQTLLTYELHKIHDQIQFLKQHTYDIKSQINQRQNIQQLLNNLKYAQLQLKQNRSVILNGFNQIKIMKAHKIKEEKDRIERYVEEKVDYLKIKKKKEKQQISKYQNNKKINRPMVCYSHPKGFDYIV